MDARRKRLLRALENFEHAHAEYLDIGAIPVLGQDREEQELIDRERRRIKTNFTRTRNRLIRVGEGYL